LKFYFPDNQDQIDPNYNFVTETHLVHRIRQRDDLYVHEALAKPPFDGILLSLAVAKGISRARYTQAARIRLERDGIRNFFRIHDLRPRIETLGDCGAFSYVKLKEPPFSVKQVLDFNESLQIDTGLAPDHIPFGYTDSASSQNNLDISELKRRLQISLKNADRFISIHKKEKFTFRPAAVAHGWTPETYLKSFELLQEMGYKFIAIGGLVPLKTRQIIEVLRRIETRRLPKTNLHLLGISRVEAMDEFESLGVTSLDSTSPFFQAFKDGTNNYHLGDSTYSALRIPQVDGNAKVRKAIASGKLPQRTVEKLEQSCLVEVRKLDAGKSSVETVINLIQEYDSLTGIGKNKYNRIQTLLIESPWKLCKCAICKRLGIEVVIFRGSERNKSRGFHNIFNLRENMIKKNLVSSHDRESLIVNDY